MFRILFNNDEDTIYIAMGEVPDGIEVDTVEVAGLQIDLLDDAVVGIEIPNISQYLADGDVGFDRILGE